MSPRIYHHDSEDDGDNDSVYVYIPWWVGGWFWAGGMHIFIWPLNDRTNRSGDIDHHHDLAIFDDEDNVDLN